MRVLHGLNRQEREVVDEADFFLHEGLAVADAGEQAVGELTKKCPRNRFGMGR
ncbi:MAG: hypothetical protein WB341_06990 [Terracidiphilus sp.]